MKSNDGGYVTRVCEECKEEIRVLWRNRDYFEGDCRPCRDKIMSRAWRKKKRDEKKQKGQFYVLTKKAGFYRKGAEFDKLNMDTMLYDGAWPEGSLWAHNGVDYMVVNVGERQELWLFVDFIYAARATKGVNNEHN